MVVESFLIVTMTTFDFPIMLRCAWTDSFVDDPKFITQDIKGMRSVRLFYMGEFGPIVCLQDLGLIAKVSYRTLQKING